ncbi:MAG: YhbY family RNA-binding protein [Pseudomonadota bacterium]
MEISNREKKVFRQIAHHLDAVVTVATQGLTPGVVGETERALTDHELIKVRLALAERTERQAAAHELAEQCAATVIQNIGKVVVLYRKNPKADPKLSNIARYT